MSRFVREIWSSQINIRDVQLQLNSKSNLKKNLPKLKTKIDWTFCKWLFFTPLSILYFETTYDFIKLIKMIKLNINLESDNILPQHKHIIQYSNWNLMCNVLALHNISWLSSYYIPKCIFKNSREWNNTQLNNIMINSIIEKQKLILNIYVIKVNSKWLRVNKLKSFAPN